MKKAVMMVLCFALLAVLGGCQKTGYFTSGDYGYDLYESGNAIIRAYHGGEAVLTLPARLDGHPVTGIGGYSFNDTRVRSVISLEIPEGYTEIVSSAFQNSLRLESVKLPGTLKYISSYAFSGTQSLRRLELPEGLTTLGDLAFGDSALESIHIPDTVTDFRDNPFAGCRQLREIIISDRQPMLRWTGGVLTNQARTDLLVYPASRTETRYSVPEGILNIAPYAFAGCPSLQSIELPSGVEKIGGNAFSGCTALESAVVPASVTAFGPSVFEGCERLTLVVPWGSAAEQYAKENKLPYRYSEPEAQAEEAPGGTAVPSTAASANQTQMPSVTQPSAAREPPAFTTKDFRWPVPAPGERLYIGEAEVSQADQLYVAFILSSDGTEIHDLTIYLADLAIRIESGNTVTELTGGTVTERYSGSFGTNPNAFALNLGRTQITDFTITGGTASCILAYVYHHSGSIGSPGSSADVPFDVATVAFQRQ